MLDSTIRKSYFIISINVSSFISRSVFTEVRVIMIIMNTILKLEWIRLLIISITSNAMTSLISTAITTVISTANTTRISISTRNSMRCMVRSWLGPRGCQNTMRTVVSLSCLG